LAILATEFAWGSNAGLHKVRKSCLKRKGRHTSPNEASVRNRPAHRRNFVNGFDLLVNVLLSTPAEIQGVMTIVPIYPKRVRVYFDDFLTILSFWLIRLTIVRARDRFRQLVDTTFPAGHRSHTRDHGNWRLALMRHRRYNLTGRIYHWWQSFTSVVRPNHNYTQPPPPAIQQWATGCFIWN